MRENNVNYSSGGENPLARGKEKQPETFWEIQKRLFKDEGRSNKEFGELLKRISERIIVNPFTPVDMLKYLRLLAQGKSQLEAAKKFKNIRASTQRVDIEARKIFSVERADMLDEFRKQDRSR